MKPFLQEPAPHGGGTRVQSDTISIWQLTSETGNCTECHLNRVSDGLHRITILHNGAVVASEAYDSERLARAGAWELNRRLLTRGWSERRAAAR
jgi:hypothetical protein